MDSPTVPYSVLLSQGYDFPDLVAKTGEFRYMVFGMHDYSRPFARIRYKMTSKKDANSRKWTAFMLADHTLVGRNGKNPCFTHPIGICHWREPTGIEKLSNLRS